jgi:Tfp pilus assembly protein PilN
MIEINLLPEELIVKPGDKKPLGGFDLRYVVYALPVALVIIVCLHFLLGVMAMVKRSELSSLNIKWQNAEPQRKELEEFNREYVASEQDAALIKPLIDQRISWSQKLNRLSLDLPSGIWFNDITINTKELIIRGSVISTEKIEMSLIKTFMDTLKDDTEFIKNFTTLELGPIQSQPIAGNEISNFTLKATLQTK